MARRGRDRPCRRSVRRDGSKRGGRHAPGVECAGSVARATRRVRSRHDLAGRHRFRVSPCARRGARISAGPASRKCRSSDTSGPDSTSAPPTVNSSGSITGEACPRSMARASQASADNRTRRSSFRPITSSSSMQPTARSSAGSRCSGSCGALTCGTTISSPRGAH